MLSVLCLFKDQQQLIRGVGTEDAASLSVCMSYLASCESPPYALSRPCRFGKAPSETIDCPRGMRVCPGMGGQDGTNRSCQEGTQHGLLRGCILKLPSKPCLDRGQSDRVTLDRPTAEKDAGGDEPIPAGGGVEGMGRPGGCVDDDNDDDSSQWPEVHIRSPLNTIRVTNRRVPMVWQLIASLR